MVQPLPPSPSPLPSQVATQIEDQLGVQLGLSLPVASPTQQAKLKLEFSFEYDLRYSLLKCVREHDAHLAGHGKMDAAFQKVLNYFLLEIPERVPQRH